MAVCVCGENFVPFGMGRLIQCLLAGNIVFVAATASKVGHRWRPTKCWQTMCRPFPNQLHKFFRWFVKSGCMLAAKFFSAREWMWCIVTIYKRLPTKNKVLLDCDHYVGISNPLKDFSLICFLRRILLFRAARFTTVVATLWRPTSQGVDHLLESNQSSPLCTLGMIDFRSL